MSTEEGKRRPSGDFRGSYGYGRPAHRTDPDAHYGFDRDAMPLLPTAKVAEEAPRPSEDKADPPVKMQVVWPS